MIDLDSWSWRKQVDPRMKSLPTMTFHALAICAKRRNDPRYLDPDSLSMMHDHEILGIAKIGKKGLRAIRQVVGQRTCHCCGQLLPGM